MVDVVNDGGQVVASGGRDDDLAGASVDVGLGLRLAGVEAGALEHDVNAQLAPRQLSSIGLGVDGDLLAVDGDVVLASLNDVALSSVVALGGVVLQQVSQHLGGSQVVDGDNFVALSAEHLTESKATNAAETINSNFNSHDKNLLNSWGNGFNPNYPDYIHIVPQSPEKYKCFSSVFLVKCSRSCV